MPAIGFLQTQCPEDLPMRGASRRFGILVAAALACAGAAQAQPANPEVPATARTVNLSLEQRHVIRELVRELKVGRALDDKAVAAGDQVSGKVELHPMPALIAQKVPQIKAHRFYVTEHQIVIVDPQDTRVVEVIE